MASLPMPPTNYPGTTPAPDGVMVENTNAFTPIQIEGVNALPMPPVDSQFEEPAAGYPF